jgi:5-methylcytosine-specific restriction protein B
VAHEASRFFHFYKEFGDFPDGDDGWINDALDAVIVQKLLPKLHGSRGKLEGLLWALANVCGAERDGTREDFLKVCEDASNCADENRLSPEAVLGRIESATPPRRARYAESFAKVMRMHRKLVRDQFVSFAEA